MPHKLDQQLEFLPPSHFIMTVPHFDDMVSDVLGPDVVLELVQSLFNQVYLVYSYSLASLLGIES